MKRTLLIALLALSTPAMAQTIPADRVDLIVHFKDLQTSVAELFAERDREKDRVRWWAECAKDRACLDWVLPPEKQH